MERVVRYVNEKFKEAGNSREVQSQKEELIADLHDRIHEAMSRGKTEDEAFDEAVAAMDGLEELTDALGGKRRTVFVNRLNFHHSLLVFAVIALEILAFGAYQFVKYMPVFKAPIPPSPTGVVSFNMPATIAIFVGLGIALLATAVYPLICGMICKVNPGKAQNLDFHFRKSLMTAVIGWLTLSAFLAAVNFLFPTYANSDMNNVVEMFIQPYPVNMSISVVCWFIWPLIGISNWPLSMFFYGLLFRRKRYAAG